MDKMTRDTASVPTNYANMSDKLNQHSSSRAHFIVCPRGDVQPVQSQSQEDESGQVNSTTVSVFILRPMVL